MSDTGGSDPQFAEVPGAVTHRFRAAPIAATPQGPEAVVEELGAMADAMEHHFTAETLATRLETDADAKGLAAIAALALALRGLSPSDAATVNRILADGPRAKRPRRG